MRAIQKYALRRPFSRQIRLLTDVMREGSKREQFLRRFADLLGHDPLATSIAINAAAYGNDLDGVRSLCHTADNKLMHDDIEHLLNHADLRKYLLACLRDLYQANKSLSPQMAEGLRMFSERFDKSYKQILVSSRSQSPKKLIAFDKCAIPKKPLKIGFFLRGKFFPTSRTHDLPYRFISAFESAGASCKIYDPDEQIAEMEFTDITLIDDPHVFRKNEVQKRAFLEKVRTKTKRMVMFEADPWARGLEERAKANADLYDRIWAMTPNLLDDEGNIFGIKGSCMLFPVGAPKEFNQHLFGGTTSVLPGAKFCGGVEEFNYSRYFWIIAAVSKNPEFSVKVTNHYADGLPPQESLLKYIRELGSHYGCVNFLRRRNGQTALVGRTSDVLRMEKLLIQEHSSEACRYFEPKVHFAEFSSLSELIEHLDGLKAGLGKYRKIRKEGAQFFKENYSDIEVLRHLITWL